MYRVLTTKHYRICKCDITRDRTGFAFLQIIRNNINNDSSFARMHTYHHDKTKTLVSTRRNPTALVKNNKVRHDQDDGIKGVCCSVVDRFCAVPRLTYHGRQQNSFQEGTQLNWRPGSETTILLYYNVYDS